MGVIEASDRAWKGVQMTGEKQGAAEWLRGIVGESYRKNRYPSCAGIMRAFGVECPDMPSHGVCILTVLTAIADRIESEQALPEGIEWPRFDDGGLVKVGDEVEHGGKAWEVGAICFDREEWSMALNRNLGISRMSGSYDERLKRPKLNVLDADGAPISVGDTVYGDDEASPLSVVRLFKDATGATLVDSVDSLGTYFTFAPSRLTHERPDSWERIEEDAKLAPRAYLEARGMNPEKTERIASMMADLVRRAKALSKGGQR